MIENLTLFIDFDNTLSDMAALDAQFVRELGHLLSGEFGSESATWESALKPELDATRGRYAVKFTGDPLAAYNQWIEAEREKVTTAVFASAGVPLPSAEPIAPLAKRLQFDALTACNAALPEAKSCLRELFEMGVHIQMASTQESEYLLAALIGAGLESYIESKFGPDLVDCAKEGPEFYQRIFQQCEIRPSRAIVVDDQAMCLDWAEEAGARVVQACLLPDSPEPEFPIVLRSLADLPKLVQMGLA